MSLVPTERNSGVLPAAAARVLASAWWRTAWLVLVLAWLSASTGIATWIAVEGLGDAAAQALQRATARGALPSLLVNATSTPVAADELRGSPTEVRAVLMRQVGVVTVRASSASTDVVMLGAELAKEVMARPLPIDAAARSQLGGDGLLLDADSAARLVVQRGDVLQVQNGDRTIAVTLLGTLDAVAGGSTRGFAVAELGVAQRAFGRTTIDQAELLIAADVDADGLRDRLQAALRDRAAVVVAGDRDAHAASAAAMRTTWRLAGLLALAFAIVALLAAIGDQVRATARERAQLHALGAPPLLLRVLVVVPAIVIAVLATIVGVVVGDNLQPCLRGGCERWVEMQTGVRVVLEGRAREWWSFGALVGCFAAAAASFALLVARRPQRASADVRAAMRMRRWWLAFFAFAVVLLLARTGFVQHSPLLRALDLLCGIGAVVVAMPPLALLLARLGRPERSPARLLAVGQLQHGTGSCVAAARVLVVAITMVVALSGIAGSLQHATPALAQQRLPGDFVVSTMQQRLGMPTNSDPLADALRAASVVTRFAPSRAAGVFDVWTAAGEQTLLQALPAGAVVAASPAARRRFEESAASALSTIDTMILLVLAAAAAAVWFLWWLDDLRRSPVRDRLHALGARRREFVATRLWLAAWLATAAFVVAAGGGLLLGHAWTRGPLRSVLGWDCTFVAPWPVVGAVAVLSPLFLLATAALGACVVRARPIAS